MKFWLGTHKAHWLEQEPDLFISRRTLFTRKNQPTAIGPWALDSGGFTELHLYGEWRTSEREYVSDVRWFEREIGNLSWVAPMDWMCEPFMLEKTGLALQRHQELTVQNFMRLREELGELVIPVLQGWERSDYHRCWEMYAQQGIELESEPLVGLGSICRRQNMAEAGTIIRSLSPLRLHGFGIKQTGIFMYGDALVSADSMAWSYQARREPPLYGCTHKACQNCLKYARLWKQGIHFKIDQMRLEV